ncbi:transposase family protein [Streptomyces atratus]|uniref:transposase family protein n=1 Tax=Streptomyces atratus TaxID=1893 RepID=UPI00166FC809|nr:transposase family protein [Streptomyces atratus]WPW27232.1 transposase family protein [Streptomyces atratus]GGT56691.1 hypothetical protein GCM10010207_65770 [Streptomyces atratus]
MVPSGLLDALARVLDPRDRRGRRFALATLLAVGVCAMTCADHNSLVAIAGWARRCEQEVLARLGCPYDPFAGCYRVPGERTLRDAFARVDPAALTAAGFARLAKLRPPPLSPSAPDETRERGQRRTHREMTRARTPAVNGSFDDVSAGQTDRTSVKRMIPRLGLPNRHIVGLT